jgi:acetyl-CoA carboxylase, biotin carboxylase subunit
MFKKILIANRGEIAVRIIQTCREMGIQTLAVYEAADRGSLHVRMADEAVEIEAGGFLKPEVLVKVATQYCADAVHPGYGFLAEIPEFIRACTAAGVTFIGTPAAVLDNAHPKLNALAVAEKAGIPTVTHSPDSYDETQTAALNAEAEKLGFPLVIKSCSGGRGPGERLARTPAKLEEAVRSAQAEAFAFFGSRCVYLEKAIIPVHQVSVQILADKHGNVVHLGEREGSLLYGNRKLIEESPAPSLDQTQREQMWQNAVQIAKLFKFEGAGTVEFLVDKEGTFYFTEIKARIQTEHPITELRTGLDLIAEQIFIAAGEPLSVTQADIRLTGWAMLCRINAEDPQNRFMPSPGKIERIRLPGGSNVRVDTYADSSTEIPGTYDPLFAKLSVWGSDRKACLRRLQRALGEFLVEGMPTNLPYLTRIVHAPAFIEGEYSTNAPTKLMREDTPGATLRDLAAIAAVLYLRRNLISQPVTPTRMQSGWHRDSRRLPQ